MRKRVWILAVGAIILIMFLTPLNVSQFRLNADQRQSLCDALEDELVYDDGLNYKSSMNQTTFDIYRILGFGNELKVRGFINHQTFSEVQGKCYLTENSPEIFTADIIKDGNQVKIKDLRCYENSDGMSLRFICEVNFYWDVTNRWNQARYEAKAEKELGVPFDSVNDLDIDHEEGTYVIYAWSDGMPEPEVKYRGKLSEICKS